MKTFNVAVIAGDGIGKEVVPEGIRVLEAAGQRFGFQFKWHPFAWSCETYVKTGSMMPANGIEQLRRFCALFLGAVGHPTVPAHSLFSGLLFSIRPQVRQHVILRPPAPFQGIATLRSN